MSFPIGLPSLLELSIELKRTPTGSNSFCLLYEFEVFVSLEASGTDLDPATACLLGECCPLEIGIFALVTGWIELCRTDAI